MAEKLEIKILATDETGPAMASARKGAQKTEKAFGKSFMNLGQGVLKWTGIAAGAIAGLAVAGAGIAVVIGKDLVETAMDYESAFAGVVKTTDGLTSSVGVLNDAGQELKQGFMDLSETVPVKAETLMNIGELGGQLGIQKENLLDFTETIAEIGMSTDLATEEASMGFAQFMNVMGTAQEDVRRIGSAIVDLGNNFATTEPQILSFGQRIAGAGKIAGLTEADVLAIGAAMSSVGVQAEAGGTATQKVLMAMNTAVATSTDGIIDNSGAISEQQQRLGELNTKLAIAKQRQSEYTDKTKQSTRMAKQAQIDKLTQQYSEQIEVLEILQAQHGQIAKSETLETFAKIAGVTSDEFKQLWEEDAGRAFTHFVEGLGEAGDDAILLLDELDLKDQRLVRAFLSLGEAGSLLDDTMQSANASWEENTALTDEAAQRTATAEAQLQLLHNQWRNMKATLGQAFLPVLNEVVGVFRQFLKDHGPALVTLFEGKIVPAVETLADSLGMLLEGDLEGALTNLVGEDTAEDILTFAGNVSTLMDNIRIFVDEHGPELKAALLGIGGVLAAAGIAAAIGSIVSAIAMIATPVGAVIAAVGLLSAAWKGNWGGIQEKTRAVIDKLLEWMGALLTKWEEITEKVGVQMEIGEIGEPSNQSLLPGLDTSHLHGQGKAIFGGNAAGTYSFGGGMTLVGERGPEMVSLPRGSQIASNRETQEMGGGGSTNNFNITINAPSGDAGAISDSAEIGVRRAARNAGFA